MTGRESGSSAEQPGVDRVSDAQIAAAAARQASAVPGVLRLQPGLKHTVGRAARALFATGGEDDRLTAAASGVEVSHSDTARSDTSIRVTLRLSTATDPSPWAVARAVQETVTEQLSQLTGGSVSVTVVIVDVEDVEDRNGQPSTEV